MYNISKPTFLVSLILLTTFVLADDAPPEGSMTTVLNEGNFDDFVTKDGSTAFQSRANEKDQNILREDNIHEVQFKHTFKYI